ncbi:CHAT domain-containing protein [Parasphingorhabdus halotolerans]|uniref:CHAT domain-containing protein n=1 Tax=Parasphingorhabdus halotolerans TaxID=2725558 RepID=A0A6H2DR89_9SPHN|nr:CHAT domain-containing tetratricopeptide repeat protein [Parasphingorhabdus halotolerans]QJB70465.1 CHAT domain-containing protein [Parasphingorhabdus halotolerans]
MRVCALPVAFIATLLSGPALALNVDANVPNSSASANSIEEEFRLLLLRDRFDKPKIERDVWLDFTRKVEADSSVAPTILAQSYKNLAVAYFYTQELDKGWQNIESAYAVVNANGLEDAAYIYDLESYASLISTDLKDAERAKLYANKAIARVARVFGEESGKMALALNALAYSGFKLGDRAEAMAIMCRAAELGRRTLPATDRLRHINSINCGVHMHYMDDPRAGDVLDEAAVAALQALPPDHALVGYALNASGAVLYRNGRYADAERIFRRQMEIETGLHGRNSASVYEPLSMLTAALTLQGKFDEAYTLQREVVNIADIMTGVADFREKGQSRVFLATLMDRTGHSKDSLPVYDRAIEEFKKTLEPGEQSIARAEIARAWHIYQYGDPAAAVAAAQAPIASLIKSLPDSHQDRLKDELRYAAMLSSAGQKAEALQWAKSASARLEKQMFNLTAARPEMVSLSEVMKVGFGLFAKIAVESGAKEDAVRAAQLALISELAQANADMAVRAAAQNDEVSALLVKLKTKRQDANALRAKIIAAVTKNDGEANHLTAALTDLQNEIDEIDDEISGRFPDYVSLSRPSPLPLAELQAQLTDQQVVIFPLELSNEILTIAVSRDAVTWGSAKGSPRETAALIKRIRMSIDDARAGLSDGTASFDRDAAHQLFKRVLPETLYQRLANKKELLFPASGLLASISPALLVTSGGQGNETPWLVRDKSIAIFSGFISQPTEKSDLPSVRFAGFGNPALSQKYQGSLQIASLFRGGEVNIESIANLPSLPSSKEELNRLSAVFGNDNSILITGSDLTETSAKSFDFSSFSVVAFATHGLTSGEIDGLSEPALVLTPPATASTLDDGLLTASEISRLSIPVDWVILSACNSSGGLDASAPTYSGLAKAFRLAGTRSLLLSHWPVRDDAAAILSVETVKNAKNGMTRAEALRQAQLKLMADPAVSGAAHPAVWAPFILIGD